ncbi:MAG: dTMP kinase [Deltaproteobacteria bacterium]|nr:dTMP kinase [Deltaproteobacteria bacterium]
MTPPRGRLIALEGLDGAGTTTQARLLVERLVAAGLPAYLTREPTDGPIGRLAREALRGGAGGVSRATLALLFAADRLDHLAREIQPQLEAGIHVVSDRYVYSSLAYQSLDLDPAWVAELNRHAPDADLTVWLDVVPEVAQTRLAQRGGPREIFDPMEQQRRVAASYEALLGGSADRGAIHGRAPRAVRIDGTQPVLVVGEEIFLAVEKICGAPTGLPA